MYGNWFSAKTLQKQIKNVDVMSLCHKMFLDHVEINKNG